MKKDRSQHIINNFTDIQRFRQKVRLMLRQEKADKRKMDKLATECGIENTTLIKELVELAIQEESEQFIFDSRHNKIPGEKIYKGLVKIYNNQVNLSLRTSQSIMLQQYSTPVPIAYLAGEYVRKKIHDKDYQVLEPSAGNGLLTIAFPYDRVWVNEIDDIRHNNLQIKPYLHVSKIDATGDIAREKSWEKRFNGIITNPPFGTIENNREHKIIDSKGNEKAVYKIKHLDHLMAINALDCMKDNGAAAIIIGGHTEYDEKGRVKAGKNRAFLSYLYHYYNVDDIINIDGSLYSRQGTSFNVRLILISGRKREVGGFPPAKTSDVKTIDCFNELYQRVSLNFTDVNSKKAVKETTKTSTQKAYDLGINAFKEGKKRVPAHDSNLMKLIEGYKVGDGSEELMKNWLKGWDEENNNSPIDYKTEKIPQSRFSKTKEISRFDIELRPKLFQGRLKPFAKETVEKIVNEGYDKSQEPIIVWFDPETTKFIVISGHSRFEASRILFEKGDRSLQKIPVKIFNGDLEEAINYAVLESNRGGMQEGVKSDIKAFNRAVEQGYNKQRLKALFKPESYMYWLQSVSHLNFKGRFIEHIDTTTEKSFPYLRRNAEWVGTLRKMYSQLTSEHEAEIFEFMYKTDRGLKIKKNDLFHVIDKKAMAFDFDNTKPLQLDRAKTEREPQTDAEKNLRELERKITELNKERVNKEELIATLRQKGDSESIKLAEQFKERVSLLNRALKERHDEKIKLESYIRKAESKESPDLFTQQTEKPKAKPEKQPWEMTREEIGLDRWDKIWDKEYDDKRYDQNIGFDKITANAIKKMGISNEYYSKYIQQDHEEQIQQALSEGKQVPEKVLKDYPDLKKSGAAKINLDVAEAEMEMALAMMEMDNLEGISNIHSKIKIVE